TGDETPALGDYVLIHVGFALSKIDEQEAMETLRLLEGLGEAYTDELSQLEQSSIT
ncbi:MAG TPA: HypC/HybG/HupF family hydrogenase formation chaperone, partial [Candidatus Dormibacteraeota bacterium]